VRRASSTCSRGRALQRRWRCRSRVLAYTAVVNRHRSRRRDRRREGRLPALVRPRRAWASASGARSRPGSIAVLPRAARPRAGPARPARRRRTARVDVELSRLITSKLDSALHPKDDVPVVSGPASFSAASAADPLLAPADLPPEGRWLAWLEALGTTADAPAPPRPGSSRGGALVRGARGEPDRADHGQPATRGGALLLGEKRSEQPYGPSDRQPRPGVGEGDRGLCARTCRLRARVSEEQRIRHGRLGPAGRPAARSPEGVSRLWRVLRRARGPLRGATGSARPLLARVANPGRPLPPRAADR